MEVWNTAGYLRLSREDGDKAESDSIANQRKLLERYMEEHPELHLVDYYQEKSVIVGIKSRRPLGHKDLLV